MLITLPRWNDPDAYYSQTNNVVEAILGKVKADRKLESCGPTSAVMILDAIGQLDVYPTIGGWMIQPEDLLACWFNDPRNYDDMRRIRKDIDPAAIMGNEVPQWYEAAVPAVFGVPATFAYGCSPLQIRQALYNGRGVLATMVKPGHYIAIVGYDLDTNETIYHDPWPGNTWPQRYAGKPGACRRMTAAEIGENVKPHRVEIG
jgi:hypothetical protein